MVEAFGSLLADDCSSRRAEPCSDSLQSLQATVDQRLARALSRCGAPAKAGFAVTFSGLGCPTFYGYAGDLRGRVSQCMQGELESWRFACMPPCAVVGL